MSPETLIPAADAIPVTWGWFAALMLATTWCHLLLMNAVLGGALFALSSRSRKDGPGPLFAKRMPTVLALTVNMGVPPLLFLQVLYGQFLYTSAVLSAVYWLALVGLTMGAYALLYVHATRSRRTPEVASAPGPVLFLATAALLAVSLIMTSIMSMMQRPEVWTDYFRNSGGVLLNLWDPTFIPRWLHFVFASLAVGGLFSALLSRSKAEQGDAVATARHALGLKWFTHATMAQGAAGIWWLLSLPQAVMLRFLGGSVLDSLVFLAALFAAGTALFYGFKGRAVAAAVGLGITVAFMVVVRELVRAAYLERYFTLSQLQVTEQYGPMILFFASFIFGMAAIAFMFLLHRKAGGGI